MAYLDLNSLHNPATGTSPPATYGDQIRDNFEYIHQRGPYICTSGTRPGSPSEGFLIYETDTDLMLTYSGSAWVQTGILGAYQNTFTPSLTQSGAVTKTVNYAKYVRIGRLIIGNVKLTCTGAGSAGIAIVVGLPVTPAISSENIANIGTFNLNDSSSGNNYGGALATVVSTATAGGLTGGTNFVGAADFPAALASGDIVSYSFLYEASS